jgi:hypothetical protein
VQEKEKKTVADHSSKVQKRSNVNKAPKEKRKPRYGEIQIADIFRNWFLHCRSYFTRETTVIQKLLRLTALIFLGSFIMAVTITSNEDVWFAIFFISLLLEIVFIIIDFRDRIKYRKICGIARRNVHASGVLEIAANVLLAIGALCCAVDAELGIIFCVMFCLWSIVTMLCACCPIGYNRIVLAKKIKPISKVGFWILGTAFSFFVFIVMAVNGA